MKLFILLLFILLFLSACDEDVDGNRPPIISKIISSSQDSSIYSLDIVATDPDNDPLTYSYAPVWPTLDGIRIDANNSSATVSVSISLPRAFIVVVVSDNKGGFSANIMDLKSDNRPPAILAFGSEKYKLRKNNSSKLTALVVDKDGDPISFDYEITSGDSVGALSMTNTLGNFYSTFFTADPVNEGKAQIQIKVTDDNLGIAISGLTIEVSKKLVLVDSWDTSPLPAYGIDFNIDGNLFVSGFNSGQVKIFNSLGNEINSWNVTVPGTPGVLLRALTIDRSSQEGVIYLASDRPNIFVYNQNGAKLSEIGAPFLLLPYYFLIRMDGSIVISDDLGKLHVLNLDGTYNTWGIPGNLDGQFKNPRELSLDPVTENIYVADKGNNRIQVLDSNGAYLQQWNIGEGVQFNIPHGVVVDRNSDVVFVADTGNNRIQVFEFDGTSRGGYKFDTDARPRFMVLGPDKRIYISSASDKKVHIFEYK